MPNRSGKSCLHLGRDKWRAANAVKIRETQERWYDRRGPGAKYDVWLRTKYGITLVDYEAMLAVQKGVCAICSQPPTGYRKYLGVDHCHETGKVRGLLCVKCNVAIGQLLDQPNLLRRAAEYLERSA
jgi:hypothetical protein